MKKFIKISAITLSVIGFAILFMSCKKETLSTATSETVFFRVESVSKTGQSTYSNVQAIRMK